jgi:hypothetical protein
MPFGNRRGPQGLGPKTGRAAGYCSGSPAPGYVNGGAGRFFRRRTGGAGKGFRFRLGRRAQRPAGGMR